MFLHDSRKKEYREPFGALETASQVKIAIDSTDDAGFAPESVRLMVWRDDEPSPDYYDMTEETPGAGRYRVEFRVPEEACLLWYAFEIRGASGEMAFYGNNEDCLGGEGAVYELSPRRYQITVYKAAEVPGWYKDGIVYQIFPDRFRRDDGWRERVEAANSRVNARRSDMKRIIQEDWMKPAYYVRDENGKVVEWPMYGGSLKGIENALDYLKSLGVTCIYLNPVFEASSNHRYDTGNYMKIDPVLGTDEDFEGLAGAAKERNIRIILDGVFSHTGADSLYFDKYGNYREMGSCSEYEDGADLAGRHRDDSMTGTSYDGKGAWGNEDSPYRSWYKFDENEPYGYKSWWGVEDLPEVDENDEDYREFILGESGVIAHWMRNGASGWRLDVADELPDSFIAETRKRIKVTDPEGLLMGEVWEDASNKVSYGMRRMYFMGDELDATMHYPLRDILLDYVNYTIGSSKAAERFMSLAENYPKENLYGVLNILGSHDRERIMTMMAGEQDYEAATRKVMLMSVLQYCLPGVPCIYYGDEVGLMGGADPANRSGYPWGFENLDLEYHYRMLGLIYDEHPALKDGEYRMISGTSWMDEDVFAFVRSGRDAAGTEERLLVITNRSYGPKDIDLSGIGGLDSAYALELLTSVEFPLDEEGHMGIIHMDRLSAKIICLRDLKPENEGIERSAGVICHISSVPGGKLGKGARDFVDYIASAGFSIWQLLPLNPVGIGNSPYSSYAAFAGEPDYIDNSELPGSEGLENFIKDNDYWLRGYVAFRLLKEANGGKPWYEWPEDLRDADPQDILKHLTKEQSERADQLINEQYYFFAQWKKLKAYADSRGIKIMGDLPMFMASDSADVWANKHLFRMGSRGSLKVRAGVPPDAFSLEGQDWNNPLYDWDALKAEGYEWWLRRIRQCAERFDILRVDHFRGFSEYFAIPEGGMPKDGRWQHGAGIGFLTAIRSMLRSEGLKLKLLAEDLGFLDAGVKDLLKLSGLMGMDIWQFSWDEMQEMCAKEPKKAMRRAFYTGTHDNDTLIGCIKKRLAEEQDLEGTDAESDGRALAFKAIDDIYESSAGLAIMQLQDVFLLGEEARMNVPGTSEGNWTWRVPGNSIEEAFPEADEQAKRLRKLAIRTGRKEAEAFKDNE